MCLRFSSPVVDKTNLNLTYKRSLLKFEKHPVFILECSIQTDCEQSILVSSFVAGPVDFAVSGSGIACGVICEHQLFIGQFGHL